MMRKLTPLYIASGLAFLLLICTLAFAEEVSPMTDPRHYDIVKVTFDAATQEVVSVEVEQKDVSLLKCHDWIMDQAPMPVVGKTYTVYGCRRDANEATT